MIARLLILVIAFLMAFSSHAWTIDGFARHVPEHQMGRNHEANFFRHRLINALKSIDPEMSESTLNRFTRFVRQQDTDTA